MSAFIKIEYIKIYFPYRLVIFVFNFKNAEMDSMRNGKCTITVPNVFSLTVIFINLK